MAIIPPRTPSGFPEYLPHQQIEFNRLLAIIRDVYERYGFSPLDTPDVELVEVLLAKSGGDTEKQVYRFFKGDTELCLPFDLTVPLARYVAQHESELVFPFYRYHIGRVHRGERAQKGRFREFYQCDVDVIGSTSPIVDALFPAIINEIFERFGFGEFVIRINNRMVLNGLFAGLGLESVAGEVMRAIDNMEKITRDELVAQLRSLQLTDQQVEQVLEFTAITGTNDEVLAALRQLDITSEVFLEGVAKLEQVVQALRLMNVPEHRFKVDLKIARGLDYYTGTVYETNLVDYPQLGSVCSGGRYDNLAGLYTKTSLPGVGISIGLSRLFYALLELGVINSAQKSPADIVVMPLTEEQIPEGLAVAQLLRSAGRPVLLYTEQNRIKQKLQYADRMGFPWVVLIGANDAQDGVVTLKDMTSGDSTTVPRDELLARLAS